MAETGRRKGSAEYRQIKYPGQRISRAGGPTNSDPDERWNQANQTNDTHRNRCNGQFVTGLGS